MELKGFPPLSGSHPDRLGPIFYHMKFKNEKIVDTDSDTHNISFLKT